MAIDCALAIRDESGRYYQYAYVTMLSLFDNTREKVRVHILHDDLLTDEGKNSLTDLAWQYDQEIIFHKVPSFELEIEAAIKKWFNLGTMYRFYMADFIDADTAIYLDCDVIVNRDIKDLYSIPIGESLVAAAPDLSNYWNKDGSKRRKYREKVEYLKLKPEDCFEAGVMLINLKLLRKLNGDGNFLAERTIAAILAGVSLHYPDQDVLNAVCAELPNGLLRLDPSFNFMIVKAGSLNLSAKDLKGKIVQYVCKPYDVLFPAHLLFWSYYARTPFSGDLFERMDAACRTKRMQFFINYARNPRYRRGAAEFLAGGFGGMFKYYIGKLFKGRKR